MARMTRFSNIRFPALLLAATVAFTVGNPYPKHAGAQDVPFLPGFENDNQGAQQGPALPNANGFESQDESQGEDSLPPSFFDVPDINNLESSAQSGPGAPGKNGRDLVKEQSRQEAFDAALQGLLPLRPEEIRQVLERFDRTQESVELPIYPDPKPKMSVETVSLDPGAQPLTIQLSYGNVTTLSILDVTGAAWPIQDITWAGNFEVIEGSEEGAHLVRLSPQSEYARGNMSMRLLGLKTPVIFTLETNRDVVHYRLDAIIPEIGPLGQAPLIESSTVSITAGNSQMAAVLQGLPPGGAEHMEVSGTDGRTSAYRMNGVTYVRTPLTLLSPSWQSSVASADGTRVYEIQDAPVLLMSDKGRMVRVRLSQRAERYEDFVDEQ